MKLSISILIPCHNEEKSIRSCLESCLAQTRPFDQILVVNDGSTDGTPEILKSFGDKIQVVHVYPATGNKSHAQEKGLPFVTGDVFASTDGDTLLDKNFAERLEIDFQNDKVAAVAGYVRSIKSNWITAYRSFEYIIGQQLHKQAQSILSFVFVIPGASGGFRTSVFREFVNFDHDTLTEDLDFTYKLHKNNFKIVYDKKAIVYTQDPDTLSSYIGQVTRWFCGGWQNLKKHFDSDLFDDPRRVLELSLMYCEGLVFTSLLFITPFLNLIYALKSMVLFYFIVAIEVIFAAIIEKRIDILSVLISSPFMIYINSYVFLKTFISEIILGKKNLVWYHPARRAI
jgi:cellulose synthase/poly-beta-1,6-N-acetylglucosamine synthase-like glycosyltransferase